MTLVKIELIRLGAQSRPRAQPAWAERNLMKMYQKNQVTAFTSLVMAYGVMWKSLSCFRLGDWCRMPKTLSSAFYLCTTILYKLIHPKLRQKLGDKAVVMDASFECRL